jgi:hypothetical protein
VTFYHPSMFFFLLFFLWRAKITAFFCSSIHKIIKNKKTPFCVESWARSLISKYKSFYIRYNLKEVDNEGLASKPVITNQWNNGIAHPNLEISKLTMESLELGRDDCLKLTMEFLCVESLFNVHFSWLYQQIYYTESL